MHLAGASRVPLKWNNNNSDFMLLVWCVCWNDLISIIQSSKNLMIYIIKTSPKGMFRKNMLDASPTYSSIMAASTYIAGRMSRLYYLLGLLVLKDFFFKYVCFEIACTTPQSKIESNPSKCYTVTLNRYLPRLLIRRSVL